MKYLTSSDQKFLSILAGYPARPLTDRERLIQDIQKFDQSYKLSTDMSIALPGQERADALKARIKRDLVNDPDLANAALNAMHDPDACAALVNRYPYVKYDSLINAKKHTGLMGMFAEGHSEFVVNDCISVLTKLAKIMQVLPNNNDGLFVFNHVAPPIYQMRNVAINHKVPELFGIAVSAEAQHLVFDTFRPSLLKYIKLAIEYKLVNNRLIQDQVLGLKLVDIGHFPEREVVSVIGNGKAYNFFVS